MGFDMFILVGDDYTSMLLRNIVRVLAVSSMNIPNVIGAAIRHPATMMGPRQLAALPGRADTPAGKALLSWTPLTWKPSVVEHVNVLAYGGGIGHEQFTKSGEKAYMHAVAWAMTKDRRHADKVNEILDAWARGCKSFVGPNGPIEASWGTAGMARAAELVKYVHDGSGWKPETGKRYFSWVDRLLWKHITAKLAWDKTGNNWQLIKLEAQLQVELFRNNATYLQQAAQRYKQIHDTFLDSRGVNSDFRREMIHGAMALGSLINIAEMLYQQGIDVYSHRNALLLRAIELGSGVLLGEPSPVPQQNPQSNQYVPVGYDIAINHYTRRKRLAMPKTTELMHKKRPERVALAWGLGTLTHKDTSLMGPQ